MSTTRIEWTDATWNPVVGCAKASPGCARCYAETMGRRLRAMGRPEYQEAHDGLGWTGRAVCLPERLGEPLRWRKPRRVFVVSMGDLFHETVPFEFVAAVWGVMAACPQHSFQILTKRPDRMRGWMEWQEERGEERRLSSGIVGSGVPFDCIVSASLFGATEVHRAGGALRWPLPNVWLGVTAEDQQRADERIPLLLQCPAAVRFMSVEPMLGEVDLVRWTRPRWGAVNPLTNLRPLESECLDWCVCGSESGPGARPMRVEWARSLRDQCQRAGVPFFYKQGPGDHGPAPCKMPTLDGRQWAEMPR